MDETGQKILIQVTQMKKEQYNRYLFMLILFVKL